MIYDKQTIGRFTQGAVVCIKDTSYNMTKVGHVIRFTMEGPYVNVYVQWADDSKLLYAVNPDDLTVL